MSDPSDRLGPRARAILDAGRNFDEPSDGDRARVRARLAAALGVSTLAAAGAQTAAASSVGAGIAEAMAASGAAPAAIEAGAGAVAATKLGAAASGAVPVASAPAVIAANSAVAGVRAAAAVKLGAAVSGTGAAGVLTVLGGKGLISLIGAAVLGVTVATTVVLRQPAATASGAPATATPSPTPRDRTSPAATTGETTHPAAVAPVQAISARDAREEPQARVAAQSLPVRGDGIPPQPQAFAHSSTAVPKPATRPAPSSVAGVRTPATQRSRLVPLTPERSAPGADEKPAEAAPPLPQKDDETEAVASGANDSAPEPPITLPPTAAAASTNQPADTTVPKPEPPPTGDARKAGVPPSAAAQSTDRREPDAIRTPAPRPVAKAPALTGELKLLAAAQQAIRRQELSRALDLLDDHAARFPRGALRPERLAASAVVLCRMSETNAGRAALHRLEAETPDSPLLAWAREACGM